MKFIISIIFLKFIIAFNCYAQEKISNFENKEIKIEITDSLNTNKTKSLELDSSDIPDKTLKLFEKNLPKIKEIFNNYIAPVAIEAFNNDEFMTIVFNNGYELMPIPFKLVINKRTFTKFCLKHRYKIVPIKK